MNNNDDWQLAPGDGWRIAVAVPVMLALFVVVPVVLSAVAEVLHG